MANYLDYDGLEFYTELINSHLNSEISTAAETLSEQIQQGLADFSNALLFQGFIDGTTNMTTAHSDAKKGHVYIVKTAGSQVTYIPSTGNTAVTETLERGDTLICLNSPNDDSDNDGDEYLRWGALQTNWSVVIPSSVPALSGTSEITLATIGGVDIKAKLSKSLGDAASYGVASTISSGGTGLPTAGTVYNYLDNHLGTAATKDTTSSIEDFTPNSDMLPDVQGVMAYIKSLGLSNATAYATHKAYQAGDYVIFENDLWKVTADITAVDNTEWPAVSKTKVTGNIMVFDENGNITDSGHAPSEYKTKQTAKSDPTASGTSANFIDAIIQNEQGVITATKKTVRSASSSQSGLMSSTHYSKLEGIASGATADSAMPRTGTGSVQAAFNAGISANLEPD